MFKKSILKQISIHPKIENVCLSDQEPTAKYLLDGVFPNPVAKLRILCVGEARPERPGDAIDMELTFIDTSPEDEVATASGSRVSRVRREKMPRFGSHWKQRLPETQPSFLPLGSSSTIPAQSPGAKWVSPMQAMWPGRWPPTQMRWPMMKLSVSVVRTTL